MSLKLRVSCAPPRRWLSTDVLSYRCAQVHPVCTTAILHAYTYPAAVTRLPFKRSCARPIIVTIIFFSTLIIVVIIIIIIFVTILRTRSNKLCRGGAEVRAPRLRRCRLPPLTMNGNNATTRRRWRPSHIVRLK